MINNIFTLPCQIINHLGRFEKTLWRYRDCYEKLKNGTITIDEIQTKLIPTAIIRFQILVIELLMNNYLILDEDWNFNIYTDENIDDFAHLAIDDIFIWLEKLWQLKYKKTLSRPQYHISIIKDIKAPFLIKGINVDFSLLRRYTDENFINPDILYVRTDYFDNTNEKNYFKVSTVKNPVNYNVTQEDAPVLEFFLENIFDKPFFREGQLSIITNVLNRNDTIGLLPTGGGKSLCYQLPCLLQPSINFVVCPIKSLMNDQNENLRKMYITNVHHINSDLPDEERRKIESDFERGRYLFVWISPEKLQIPIFRDKLLSIINQFSISYAVIDEVHCLSEWGHEFRTSYLNMAKTINKLSPKDEDGEEIIKFIGLTATASVNVLKDIKIEFSKQNKKLADENIKSLLDYSRKELMFEVINDSGNKQKILQERLQEYKDNALLTETEEKSAIIFTPHVNGGRGCYPLSNYLNAIYPQKCNWFSGQAPKTDEVDANGNRTGKKIPIMDEETFKKHKEDVQIGFKSNKYPLLTATKAFGMGIDKDNIYYTIHYGIPSSVEALYQEAGRAGRWDKNKEENKDKKGNCIVLYSPESVNKERVDRIFQLETTFAEIEQINKEVGRRGQDVFSQVFLFVQNHKDIEEEAVIIRRIVDKYYQQNSKKKIYWNEVRREFNISEDILEKVIYRLSLLGIVSDWTTDFINYYEVEFDSCDENHIIKHISNYITKYQANANVAQNVEEIKKDTFLEKVIHYLLQWIFEHIVYNRKQSLKTLVEWCDKFEEEGNEAFKRRIDNYFKFTDATFIFQHILENPNDYKKWFEVFIHKELNDQNEVINTIYMPTILNEEERFHEFERLRDSLSRFLESSGVDNTGLNFVSGLIRLFLNQYKDSDGIERFEKSLKDIKQTFDKVIQLHIMDELKKLGDNMIENSRYDLSLSILKFYPEYIEELADRYKLPYLLTDFYIEQITKIKTLNNRIDEQLTEI